MDIEHELGKARKEGDHIKEQVVLSGKYKSIGELEALVNRIKNSPLQVHDFLRLIEYPKIPKFKPDIPEHEFTLLGFRESALFKIEFWSSNRFVWIGFLFFFAVEFDYNLKRWSFYLI